MTLETLSQRPNRLSTLPTVAEGPTYASFYDAVNAARKHAQTGQFSDRIKDQNKKRVHLCCSGDNFSEYIGNNMDKKSELITVIKFEDDHSYQGAFQVPRGSQRDHGLLVNLLEEFPISKEPKPKAVQVYLQRQLGIETPYTSAPKAKEAMLKETPEAQLHRFQLTHAYIERLTEIDPATIGILKTKADGGGEERRFHSVFFAPGAARNAFDLDQLPISFGHSLDVLDEAYIDFCSLNERIGMPVYCVREAGGHKFRQTNNRKISRFTAYHYYSSYQDEDQLR